MERAGRKGPLGVIDADWLVKRERPETQLPLVGSMAQNEPEGGFDRGLIAIAPFGMLGRFQISTRRVTSEGYGLERRIPASEARMW